MESPKDDLTISKVLKMTDGENKLKQILCELMQENEHFRDLSANAIIAGFKVAIHD